MSQDTEQSQQSPREIAEKLHRKIKRFIDADRHHYEPSGLYEIVAWIADAIESERESLAAKDWEIAAQREKLADFITTHSFATGHGDTFDDLLRELGSEVSSQAKQIAALQEENATSKSLLQAASTGKAAAEHRLAAVCKQRDALAEALKLVWSMFEDGRIVRNIANDGKPDWALNMLNFTRELQTIQAALASVDEQKHQEPTK